MSAEVEQKKPEGGGEQRPRRSREEILREIKLALTIGDGLPLEVERERARGFDPYDCPVGQRAGDVWKPRRRG